jgi:hypothetical protein
VLSWSASQGHKRLQRDLIFPVSLQVIQGLGSDFDYESRRRASTVWTVSEELPSPFDGGKGKR